MPLPSWSLCCLWHHRPQHLNHSPLILVRYLWLCSQLVEVLLDLSSCSFRVKCDNNVSSVHTSSCGVPQGSVLGPVLFVMYTTPLSTLTSSLFLDHHMQMKLSSSSLFTHLTLIQAFLTSKRSSTDLLEPTCFTNPPPPRSFPSSSGLPSRTIAWTFLLSSSVFVILFFSLFFVFVPCARLR